MAAIKIVCVRDRALGRFGQPYFQANLDVAIRNYKIAINDPQNSALYPIREDLELWELGTYEDNNGDINTMDCPRIIQNRGEGVRRENNAV